MHGCNIPVTQCSVYAYLQDLWTTTHEQYYFDFRRGRLPGMGLAPTESDLASGEVKEYVEGTRGFSYRKKFRRSDWRTAQLKLGFLMSPVPKL
jgi:hypothetical protein